MEQLQDISHHEGDCAREGFPELTPDGFIFMYRHKMGAHPTDEIRRIEFCYVEDRIADRYRKQYKRS